MVCFDTTGNQWLLIIKATMIVMDAVVNVCTGRKSGGAGPVGT